MKKSFLPLLLLVFLSACASSNNDIKTSDASAPRGKAFYKVGSPYKVDGSWYTPQVYERYVEEGRASWYGPGFHGKSTANGELFNENDLTAAHKTLPLPSIVRVTNLDNGKSAIVRVNDRGPFADNRLLDASKSTAQELGFLNKGIARVRIELLVEESKMAAAEAQQGRVPNAYSRKLANFTPPESTRIPEPTNTIAAKPLAPIENYASTAEAGSAFATPIKGGIYVQAAAFGTPKNAEAVAKQLRTVDNTIVQPADINGATLYRVRLGPYPSLEVADKSLNKVVAMGHTKAQIIIE